MPIAIDEKTLKSFHVEDDLYRVPLDAIQYASVEVHGFQNPRTILMGTEDSPDHVNGFSPEEMEDLKESIKNNGLIHNIVVWYHNNELILLCGERRRRAIDLLIENEEICKGSKNPESPAVPATELFKNLIVRVVRGDLRDAQKIAFQENEEARSIGDGATVVFVHQLKEQGYSESEIKEITNKSITWINETVSLTELDPETYSKLLKGEINRAAAKKLLQITNVDERLEKVAQANEAAKERVREIQRQQELEVKKAKVEVEIVEIQEALGEADENDKREKIERLQKQKRELAATQRRKPQIKVDDLRKVDKGKSKILRKPLTFSKVKAKFRKPCEEMLEKQEIPEGISQASAETVVLFGRFVEEGETDVMKLLQEIEQIHAKAEV